MPHALISLRDINAGAIIFKGTKIRSLENISFKGNQHETNIFVTLDEDANEELVAAVKNTLTPELVGKLAVTPAERAAREAERIRLSKRLEESNKFLEEYSRLLNPDPPDSYLAKDFDQLHHYKQSIDMHLSTAALYRDRLSANAVNSLPRIALRSVWYRLSRHPLGLANFTPEFIPTRFNPGIGRRGFQSLDLAQDMPSALFELSTHIDLADAPALLRNSFMSKVEVELNNVADLTGPQMVSSRLGLDFAAVIGVSFPGKMSVTQWICTVLEERGCEGAVFPSRNTVKRNQLVLFRRNLDLKRLIILWTGRLDHPAN